MYDSITKDGERLLAKLTNVKIEDDTAKIETNFRKQFTSGKNSLDDIISDAMLKMWFKSPKAFQTEVIRHILKMQTEKSDMNAVLLVKGTGSVKSCIVQTVGVICGGITIVVENTQALGSDQRSKIDAASKNMELLSVSNSIVYYRQNQRNWQITYYH